MLLIFCYSDDCKFAEMAVDNDWLCIGVGDDAYAAVPGEIVKLAFEFVAEIGVFDVVD